MLFLASYFQPKDIQNYLNSVWKFNYQKYGRQNHQNWLLKYYPESFQDNIKKSKTKNEAKKIIKKFLDSLPQNFYKKLDNSIKEIEINLNKNTNKIISKLENIYNKKFPFKEIKVYITTAPIFPYNYKQRWFMIGRNLSPQKQVDVALHELNHFMFYYYFTKKLKHLSREKFETIKESLAILTNPKSSNKPLVKSLEKIVLRNENKSIDEIISIVSKEFI